MRRLLPLLTIALLVSACATATPTHPVQVPSIQPAPASNQPPSTTNQPAVGAPEPSTLAELEAEARRLTEAEDWAAAAQAWEAVAKQRPTLDAWYEASLAHLAAKQYGPALTAAVKAKTFNERHPGAIYVAGAAHLGLGDACTAEDWLTSAQRLQPERWEPALALGETYLRLEREEEAAPHIERAAALGAPAAQVATAQAELIRLRTPPTMESLSADGRLLLQDGATYLYRLNGPSDCRGGSGSDWLVQNGRVSPLLPDRAAAYEADLVTLSNGQHAYLLWGPGMTAAASAYFLVVIEEGEQRLFTFTGEGTTAEGDGFLSTGEPRYKDDRLMVSERIGTGEAMRYEGRTYQLDLQQLTATQVD